MTQDPVIDVFSRAGEGRPEESRLLQQAIAEMNAAGVSLSLIAPPDVNAAVRNREGNDAIAAAVVAHPGRLAGYAVANPWYGTKAVAERPRALDCGLKGLFLHPPVQGFQLSDPLVDPLVAAAVDRGAPVYAHTGTPVCAMPLQLTALARRFPAGKFIMGHMGYADFWYDAIPAAEASGNIWLETSFIDSDLIQEAVRRLGAGRLLFGSAAPLSAVQVELAKIRGLDLRAGEIRKITYGNAAELFL